MPLFTYRDKPREYRAGRIDGIFEAICAHAILLGLGATVFGGVLNVETVTFSDFAIGYLLYGWVPLLGVILASELFRWLYETGRYGVSRSR